MNTTIKMQDAISFAAESLSNVAMLLGVIKENAITTGNSQIIEAYSAVMSSIEWVKTALEQDAAFVQRIPEIAAGTDRPFVVKAYAKVIAERYSINSLIEFANMYGESLSWEDDEYDRYGELLDAMGLLKPSSDLHRDFCTICRYMLNWYSRQHVEYLAEKPWSEYQVSIGYLLDNLGYVFGNADQITSK